MQQGLSGGAAGSALTGIVIPPCPSSLASIMREARRSSVSVNSLAQLIGRDAGIVGPLLKLANSPFAGLRSRVTSVFQAISVLGMQNTLNLVQNIALQQSLNGSAHSFEKFWERSSLTAAIAEKIAVKFHPVSKDDAYLSALFHDCGIPVLMMKFPAYRETVMAQCKLGRTICDVENDVFSTSHAVVGNLLARNWMLSEHVCKAILHHHDHDILETAGQNVRNSTCDLIGIVHMAECIADEHLFVRDKEWHEFGRVVLKYFDMSEPEFLELKGDALAYLNGE
jgi:HD-like signal output (HDOD) protein